MKKGAAVVDLFCGVGGLTHGLLRQKVNVVAGVDNDGTCQYAYEKNNSSSFILKDIKKLTGKELNSLYPEGTIRVLVGCAPCQTFSRHTLKNRNRDTDERWFLLYEFLRLIHESQPDIVSMENVPQLRKYDVFRDFINGLEKEGFFVSWKLVQCVKYGMPQRRTRLVLLASKLGPIDLIPETHPHPKTYVTVKEIIGEMPSIHAGEVFEGDVLHKSLGLAPINLERIKQSKQGGSWMDWDRRLVLKCHKKKGGSNYKAVYGRMRENAPSPTITTQFYSYGTGRFGHPTQNRAISLREGAMLQTFPKNYKFFENEKDIAFNEIGRHIGNAVPVKLGEVIAKSIKNHINQ